jgi:hypothetical protein
LAQDAPLTDESGIRCTRPSSRPTPVPREQAEAASSRPTSLPDIDLAAYVGESPLLRIVSTLPLDFAVPVRTGTTPPDIDHRSACLLLHVDGSLSIGEIATITQLPRSDVLAAFIRLLETGAIEVTAPRIG